MKTINQYIIDSQNTPNGSVKRSFFDTGFKNNILSKCGILEMNVLLKRFYSDGKGEKKGSRGRTKGEMFVARKQVMDNVPKGGGREPKDKRANLIITVPFTPYQGSVFVGWIVTDGCLKRASYSKDYPKNQDTNTGCSGALRIRQTLEFLAKGLHGVFAIYYAGRPIEHVKEKSPKSKGNAGFVWIGGGNSFPVDQLAELGRVIYPKAHERKLGVKLLPKDAILKYFNELSLVVAFCCDGCKAQSGYVICLNSYSKEEIKWFIQFLKDRFQLNCSIGNQRGGTIYIKADSREKFKQILFKYPELAPAYKYKL